MRWFLAVATMILACGGHSAKTPAGPSATDPRGSAAAPDSTCHCEATCDCHGDNDPARDQAANDAARVCVAAGVTCPPCGECLAP